MSRSELLALFLVGLLVACGVAGLQHSPGYMDADYYMAGGLRLAQGHGFSEIIIWNYLDDPVGLPHPSHSYWMPLASILAAFGMWVTGQHDFYSARLGFILLAAFVPPVTGILAYRLTTRRELALLSGLLAAFPTYQASFIATTDNFVVYNLLGAIFFLLLFDNSPKNFFALGLVAALMNFARSDGLFWLPLALLGLIFHLHQTHHLDFRNWLKPGGLALVLIFFGYFLVMLPWFSRNLAEFGTFMAPGGSRAMFLTVYGETFYYPASQLSLRHWLASGWQAIAQVRLSALWQNLGTGFAAQGGILLTPFILLAAWRLRHDLRVRLAGLAWLGLYLVMSLVFPFAGPRGSFFHAGAALMPFGWALTPLGLEIAVTAARRRNWFTPQAQHVFRVMLFALNLILTLLLLQIRVINGNWDSSDKTYRLVEQKLQSFGASPTEVIMVVNPPGYYLSSGRAAIASPTASFDQILAAARQYQARYLILETISLPEALQPFFAQSKTTSELRFLFTLPDTEVYEFNWDQ